MSDRYELLKDLPGLKAGEIFEDNGEGLYVAKTYGCIYGFYKNHIDISDWFYKIEEEPTEDNLFYFGKMCSELIHLGERLKKVNFSLNMYTEQDLRQARIDAFNAGRKTRHSNLPGSEVEYNLYFDAPSYISYLQSLNNK